MAFNGSMSTVVRNLGTYTLNQGSLRFSNDDNYAMVFSNPARNAYVIVRALPAISTPSVSGSSGSLQSAGLVENLVLARLTYSYTPPADENMRDLSANPEAGCNGQGNGGGCPMPLAGLVASTTDYANDFLAGHTPRP